MLTLASSPFSPSRSQSISAEISSLHNKSAIKPIIPDDNQFVSPIFDVPKKDSVDCRVILNLKVLNEFIYKTKFKLEGYDVIINMLRKNDYMCSIDLKDAFLMLSINPEFFRFLCFEWDGVRFCYTAMPFGLTVAPRIFTKIMKAVLVFLRSRGVRVTAWFDDLIIIAESVSLILEHLYFVRLTLRSLGFIINDRKSSLVPSTSMLHLGFIWDSVSFTLSVPSDKVAHLKLLCNKALSAKVSLRFLQRILGTIESFRIAFPFAALHYRHLQKEVSLQISSGADWDSKISPSPESRKDLNWWINCNPSLLPRSLAPFVHDITVTTDSSSTGWGAFTSLNKEASGFWSEEECLLHINVLETKAVFLSFLSFFRDVSGISILIKSDNITTVSYINHLGGVRSPEVSELIIKLYDFCLEREISIKAAYLQGSLNVRADALSRRTRDHCYSLPSFLFSHFCSFFKLDPTIDLFASSHNAKLNCYYSYGPDPFALGFDAFSQDWPKVIYAFPPVMLVGRFLSYFMSFSMIEGLIIVPFWPAQPYFPDLLKLLINSPVFFPVAKLEGSALTPRPLRRIMACAISSSVVKQKAFLASLSASSSGLSTRKHCAPTAGTGKDMYLGAVENKLIFATPLLTP